MGINVKHFRKHIIRPTLKQMGMHSKAAENLLLGTAIVESNLAYLHQIGGIAIGLYQMEPATHDDIWGNYLKYRPELSAKVEQFLSPNFGKIDQLRGNLHYATAMARIHYWRVPEPLPRPDDAMGLARYHKEHYNTHLGKTDVTKSVDIFRLATEL